MRSRCLLILAIFLVLGTLAAQAAVVGVSYKGQDANKGRVLVKGQDPYKGSMKPGSCPVVMIRCAMLNPPDACMKDAECPGSKKCCEGSCGRACMNPQ